MLGSLISLIMKRSGWAAISALAVLKLSAVPATAEELLLRCVYIYDDLKNCDDITTCAPQTGVVTLGFNTATKDPIELIGVDTPADKGFVDQVYRFVDRSRERIVAGWPNYGAGNLLKVKNPDTGETESFHTSYLCEEHKP